MRKDTIVSIAEKAGCSVSTVSRVLSGNASKYRISEKTAEKVMKVAKKANFTPSLLAKSLRAGMTNTIGLVIPSIENVFFAQIASILVREAKTLGYQVILTDTQEDETIEGQNISTLLARNVDGMIIMPCGSSAQKYEQLIKRGVPLVLVDRYFPNSNLLSSVSTDNYNGAKMATQFLIEHGHKDIVCIQGNPNQSPGLARKDGYIKAMEEAGLNQYTYVSGKDFSIQNGYIETKLILSRKKRPSAVFACSNQIILGAIKAIREAGLTIPEDISVVAFDDNSLFDYFDPGITSVSQPLSEISMLALKMLMDKMERPEEAANVLVPPKLVIRSSVKHVSDNQKN